MCKKKAGKDQESSLKPTKDIDKPYLKRTANPGQNFPRSLALTITNRNSLYIVQENENIKY